MDGWDRLSLDGTDFPRACDWPWKLLGDCLPPRLGMGHLVGHVWPRPPSADNGASRLTAAVVDRLKAALEGRYAIERELGESGMATVYLAADLEYGRKVALKPETRESIPDFPGQRQRSRVGAGRVGGILSRRRRPVACGAGGRQRPRAPHALRGELGYSTAQGKLRYPTGTCTRTARRSCSSGTQGLELETQDLAPGTCPWRGS
jgi:hypothetical protein